VAASIAIGAFFCYPNFLCQISSSQGGNGERCRTDQEVQSRHSAL
jgi:hypothetical protein